MCIALSDAKILDKFSLLCPLFVEKYVEVFDSLNLNSHVLFILFCAFFVEGQLFFESNSFVPMIIYFEEFQLVDIEPRHSSEFIIVDLLLFSSSGSSVVIDRFDDRRWWWNMRWRRW